MSRSFTDTLKNPDGSVLANTNVVFVARRNEAAGVVKKTQTEVSTDGAGVCSVDLEDGYYTVLINLGSDRVRLGSILVEAGVGVSFMQLLGLDNVPSTAYSDFVGSVSVLVDGTSADAVAAAASLAACQAIENNIDPSQLGEDLDGNGHTITDFRSTGIDDQATGVVETIKDAGIGVKTTNPRHSHDVRGSVSRSQNLFANLYFDGANWRYVEGGYAGIHESTDTDSVRTWMATQSGAVADGLASLFLTYEYDTANHSHTFYVNGVAAWAIDAGRDLLPVTDNAQEIGSDAKRVARVRAVDGDFDSIDVAGSASFGYATADVTLTDSTARTYTATTWYTLPGSISIPDYGGAGYMCLIHIQLGANAWGEAAGFVPLGLVRWNYAGTLNTIPFSIEKHNGNTLTGELRLELGNGTRQLSIMFDADITVAAGGALNLKLKRIL